MTALRSTGPVALACIMCVVAPANAQNVRGRTVSEPNRRPVADVAISVVDANGRTVGQTMTGSDGFFLIEGVRGRVVLHVVRIGFRPDSQAVEVAASGDTSIPAFVLVPDAVVLDTITATAESRRAAESVVGFTRRSHVVAGERMAVLERHAVDVATVAREFGPLRVRPDGWTYCIESNRRITPIEDPPDCNMVAVIVDGIEDTNPLHVLANLPLDAVESVEYLSPVEAGFRFGLRASATGALVIWTRGRGPHTSRNRD